MKPWRRAGRLLASCAVTLLVLALAPAVLLAGELVNRHYLGILPAPRDKIPVRRGRRVVFRNARPGRAAYAMAARDHRGAQRDPQRVGQDPPGDRVAGEDHGEGGPGRTEVPEHHVPAPAHQDPVPHAR